jgi:hypothetical protein
MEECHRGRRTTSDTARFGSRGDIYHEHGCQTEDQQAGGDPGGDCQHSPATYDLILTAKATAEIYRHLLAFLAQR